MTPYIAISAAAATLIAVVLVITVTSSGGRVAFADAARPLLDAQTARFDVTLRRAGQDDQKSQIVCMVPGLIRQTMADGTVNVINYAEGKYLTIDPKAKAVSLLIFEKRKTKRPVLDVFAAIQGILKGPFKEGNKAVTALPARDIDGRRAVGFRVAVAGKDKIIGWQGTGTLTIWADATTLQPVRLLWHDETFAVDTIVTNIRLNVDVEKATFRMDVPEGYELKIKRIPASDRGAAATEKKLIDGFRAWLELSRGRFPSSLGLDAVKDLDPDARVALKQHGWGFAISISRLHIHGLGFGGPGEKKPTPEQSKKINRKIVEPLERAIDGIMTVHALPASADWHYAGRGVNVTHPKTPICWYKPQGGKTYRVVYNDLSVKQLAQEDLPSARPAGRAKQSPRTDGREL